MTEAKKWLEKRLEVRPEGNGYMVVLNCSEPRTWMAKDMHDVEAIKQRLLALVENCLKK